MRYSRKIAFFSLCVALMLVLGLMDRAVPLSALLSGGVPGLKLGLANTVLLYGVFLLSWKETLLLMLAKVVLSGFLFGSLTAILYSLSGGILSLGAMLLTRRHPKAGALVICVLALASDTFLLIRNPSPRGQMLLCVILIGLGALSSLVFFLLIRRYPRLEVIGVSLCGAVFHNIGQVLMASLVLHSPRLLTLYLPVLVGLGAVVGCLTGVVAQRVMAAMRRIPAAET